MSVGNVKCHGLFHRLELVTKPFLDDRPHVGCSYINLHLHRLGRNTLVLLTIRKYRPGINSSGCPQRGYISVPTLMPVRIALSYYHPTNADFVEISDQQPITETSPGRCTVRGSGSRRTDLSSQSKELSTLSSVSFAGGFLVYNLVRYNFFS
ncbi:hypothetical protein GALMADRAFT_455522 [Galerina marginata CBS 339.88]|uniref:Uncharacterized protein n=1 Tax=Galerina marginata (strain CBS 339.88) TaxID=685588 RepID=A0A067T125_GALM3|nr:hypothetical protein GALMADRAFT_455522 [Galerina marginata CBS 339.88]